MNAYHSLRYITAAIIGLNVSCKEPAEIPSAPKPVVDKPVAKKEEVKRVRKFDSIEEINSTEYAPKAEVISLPGGYSMHYGPFEEHISPLAQILDGTIEYRPFLLLGRCVKHPLYSEQPPTAESLERVARLADKDEPKMWISKEEAQRLERRVCLRLLDGAREEIQKKE